MCSRHDPLWTTADVAAFLSVPVQTIYDWRTRGVGIAVAGRAAVPGAGLVSRLRLCASDGRAGRPNGLGGPDRA
jgi:hypothetical protein